MADDASDFLVDVAAVQGKALIQEDGEPANGPPIPLSLITSRQLRPEVATKSVLDVPARLDVSENTPSYQVTVGEISRRILPPERLNLKSLAAAYGSPESVIRDRLAAAGILLPEGNHRLYQVDRFSALPEEEAWKLSEDFYHTTLASFPHAILARSLFTKYDEGSDTDRLEAKKRDLDGFLRIIAEMAETLSTVQSPVGNRIPAESEDSQLQFAIDEYSQRTHGFGPPAVLAGLRVAEFTARSYRNILGFDPPKTPIQKTPNPSADP